jgi:hypothetical protein
LEELVFDVIEIVVVLVFFFFLLSVHVEAGIVFTLFSS